MPRVVLLGVPSDANSSYLRGCAAAPAAIRAALWSESTNSWTETGIDLARAELLADAGDVDLGAEPEDFGAIERAVEGHVAAGDHVLALGGDHAVTHPLVRGHRFGSGRERYPKLSILHFDAHPDLYADFEGNPRSHASPFARILEEGRVERLVQVGIRTITGHLAEEIERYGVEVIEARDPARALELSFDEPVYVSFDLDALDPAYAPGVSHWEPGGLSTRFVLDVLHRLDAEVVGGDVVELNPTRDTDGRSAATAARVLREIAGKIVATSIRPG